MLRQAENLTRILACPIDKGRLHKADGTLHCELGHEFRVEGEVPVFAETPRREEQPSNMAPCDVDAKGTVDPFVNDWIVNTNGNLYWHVRGRLPRYPFPQWPFERGDGKVFVELGCGWGRWSAAAGKAGFATLGLDVHLNAVAAAYRVSREMGHHGEFACADIEALPVHSGTVDMIFSYSVLQHLDKSKVARIFREAWRVLKPGAAMVVQLPNTFGIYNVLLQLRRGFREAKTGTFEMRYWSRRAILEAVHTAGFTDVKIRADGFFSQNPQLSDLDLLTPMGKLVVLVSHATVATANRVAPLIAFADSLWVEARKPD